MAYQIQEQHIDLESGFHVIILKDGKRSHIVQIAIGADACPACGHLTPKDNLGQIDPKSMVAAVNESLNKSQMDMLEYAKRHGIPVK
jgi:hypothetical protein